jgi:hypothetical protein
VTIRATGLGKRGNAFPVRWALGGAGDSAPSYEDLTVESAVLAFVVGERPEGTTIFDLGWKMNGGTIDTRENDAIERAVRELVRARLLRMEGALVVPW